MRGTEGVTAPESAPAGPWVGRPVERVEVDCGMLPVAASSEAALAAGAPVLHEGVGSNVVSDRRFAYGDFASALAGADLVIRRRFRHPRSSCTPVEGGGVICAWDAT